MYTVPVFPSGLRTSIRACRYGQAPALPGRRGSRFPPPVIAGPRGKHHALSIGLHLGGPAPAGGGARFLAELSGPARRSVVDPPRPRHHRFFVDSAAGDPELVDPPLAARPPPFR